MDGGRKSRPDRRAARAILIGSFLMTVGCARGPTVGPAAGPLPVTGTVAVSWGLGPMVPVTAAGLPPDLGGAGTQPAGAAAAPLPAPAESAARIQELVSRFGMASISGSGATLDILAKLETACSRFPPGSFNKLKISFEPLEPGESSSPGGSGVWFAVDGNGQDATGQTLPVGAEVRFTGTDLAVLTMVHELAHHETIFLDADHGRRLIDLLGYKVTSVPGGLTDNRVVMNAGDFDASGVRPDSYPSEYSRDNATEHIAELIAIYLCPNEPLPFNDAVPGFKWPASVVAEFERRYPFRPPTM